MEGKLIEVFSRTINIYNCDEEFKGLIQEILDFLNAEQRFQELYRTNGDINELKKLGFKLNLMQKRLSEKLNNTKIEKVITYPEAKTLRNRFCVLGMVALINYNVFDDVVNHFVKNLKHNQSLYTENGAIAKAFENLYEKYSIMETIYNNSGLEGISRFVLLNNKLYKASGNGIVDLLNKGFLPRDTILNLTSSESVLAAYNSTTQASRILEGNVDINTNSTKVIHL